MKELLSMEQIETRSTSLKTAECSPIVVRKTDQVRLAFVPTLVNNEGNPEACVRGYFVYQRKSTKGEWEPVATITLSSLKSGEGYKLELPSGELLALMRGLVPLYKLYRHRGIPQGKNTFVRLEPALARFLALGESDLTTFLEAHRDDAAATLLKLMRWIAKSTQGAQAASRLAVLEPDELPIFNSLLGLAAVKSALTYWSKNQNVADEAFWQRALSDRTYVLSQVFAYPIVIIEEKAYVGGKRITNQGGNVADFVGAVESTDAVVVIEIKTPGTRLLGARYRDGVYPLSSELMGALAQILRYRQSLMREYHAITDDAPRKLALGEPRCLVVAGHTKELISTAMRESFELQRERLQGVAIVTYDELFRRLERFVDLLEGTNTVGHHG
jgi:hypothetical protein